MLPLRQSAAKTLEGMISWILVADGEGWVQVGW
jgi:hypothetical protein